MASLLLLSTVLENPLVSLVLLLVGYLLGRGAYGFGTRYKTWKAWLLRWVSKQQDQRHGEQEEQQHIEAGRPNAADELSAGQSSQPDEAETPWYIGVEEGQKVVERTDQQDAGEEHGWKHMMDREMQGVFKYSAYRRATPSGLTEYRTITTAPNTSPMELMEFLLDDDARRGWEGFLAKATVLEQGAPRSREQVVRWVRRFPFHFLTDREYVIARKVWSQHPNPGRLQIMARAAPGTPLYAVTKGLEEHPAAPKTQALVRTSGFYSCWRCRAVPDPWGGSEPAAEVVLLHQENIHVPEYLARTAVSMGMSKFVKELVGGLLTFTEARRARGIDPHVPDPLAYGHDFARIASLHLEPMGSGHGVKRALDDGEVEAAADYGSEQHETGVSAAESLHMHPRHRPHRLRRLLTSRSGSKQQHGTSETAQAGRAQVVTTPTARSVAATSGNVTPLASSGQTSPVARSETDSPADLVARVRADGVQKPQGVTVTKVLHTGTATPFAPPASEVTAAWLRGGVEPSSRRRDLTGTQLPWHRKLAMGIMGAATVAGVRQLLQQQHMAVTPANKRSLSGRRSSSGHRRALSDAATMLKENRFQLSDESAAEGSDREQAVHVLAAKRLRGPGNRAVASFILPQEVWQQMSDDEDM